MKPVTGIVYVKKNSERLPGKNLKHFKGKPLFTIILETLNAHPLIDKILVNSDSEEVLHFVETSLTKGVALHRPDHLMGNQIHANDLIAHDIQYSSNEHFFSTHCTNPLLTAGTITRAIETYFANLAQCDSLFSVVKVQNRLYNGNASPINHNREETLRLQDIEPIYMENASFFMFSKDSFTESGNNRIGRNPKLIEISGIEGIDIDYEDDFILAEIIDQNRHRFPKLFG